MSSAARNAALRASAPIALMALIFWSSAQSGGEGIPEWAHVLTHFLEYAVLAALWLWALSPLLGASAWAVAAAVAIVYAITDEVHQSFVPERVADPLDVLVDSLGVAAALALANYYALSGRGRSLRTARRARGRLP